VPTALRMTPLRALELPRREGCRLLSESTVGHLDGGEAQVRAILAAAGDRSSTSDELARHDATWETRYHFARSRANVLRALELAPDAAVLEIGAGCGAISRYLGETCATVDALEPMAERAAIARLRTADLPGVEVFVGDLDAVPAEPAYDLVVLVGVLEYVGGHGGATERAGLLREAARRLRPGGHVVCAIENRLGARYLAGAAEEHYGRPYAGVEEYPTAGPARTFARRELEAIFTAAGLVPRTYGVMPDYKFARLVFADALLESRAATAAWTVPTFPSQVSPHPVPRLADERRLWRGAVRAGLGGELPNAFLVVAAAEAPALWRDDQLAVWFSTDRRAGMRAVTRLVGDARVERRRLEAERPVGGLRQRCADGPWIDGVGLIERLEEADLGEWLGRWRALVEADREHNVDLVPHNLVVAGDELATVDEEWLDPRRDAAAVIGRGVLQTALTLVEVRAPERWPAGCRTVRDAVAVVAEAAGAGWVAQRLDQVVRAEAELLVEMARVGPGEPGFEAAVREQIAHFEASLARPLSLTALGQREMDLRRADLAELERLRERLAAVEQRAAQDAAARAVVESSRSWRATAPARRIAARLRRR
jgi:SAM-dependent methyltransferase